MDEFDEICNPFLYRFDPEGRVCTCQNGLVSRRFFKLLQRFECPWHETTTLESRLVQLWIHLAIVLDPMAIPDFLQPYWSQNIRATCTSSTVHRVSMIHVAAAGMGLKATDDTTREVRAEWATLAGMVLSNTPNPNIRHVEALIPGTPLIILIKNSIDQHQGGDWKQVHSCLVLWLSEVQSSGHDLEEYGRRENELLADKELNLPRYCYFERYWKRELSLNEHVACLRGYEYGPEPKDWKILWTVPEKSYAADFWRLVEDGPQLVPGAWVEDSDDEEGDDYIFWGQDPSRLGLQSWL